MRCGRSEYRFRTYGERGGAGDDRAWAHDYGACELKVAAEKSWGCNERRVADKRGPGASVEAGAEGEVGRARSAVRVAVGLGEAQSNARASGDEGVFDGYVEQSGAK